MENGPIGFTAATHYTINAVIFFLAWAFSGENPKIAKWKIVLLIFVLSTVRFASYIITSSIGALSVILAVSMLLMFTNIIMITAICFKSTVRKVTIIIVLIIASTIAVDGITVSVVIAINDITSYELQMRGVYRHQGFFISYILFTATILVARWFRAKDNFMLNIGGAFLVGIVSLLGLVVTVVLVLPSTNYSYELQPIQMFAFITMSFIIIVGLIIMNNRAKSREKAHALALTQAKAAAQEQHIGQLMESQQQVRKMAHDFKHNVHMLHIMATEGRLPDLLAELERLGGTYSGNTIVDTGNIMLDAVLSAKTEEARDAGIATELKLNLPENANLPLPLCVLLSNALDNAIEACNRAANGVDKVIDLEINVAGGRFMCQLRNTLGETPQEIGGSLATHKKDKLHHGVGMKSMKDTAEELGGSLDFEYDNEFFVLYVSVAV